MKITERCGPVFLLAIVFSFAVHALELSVPNLPATLKPPSDHKPFFSANARGVQIYACQAGNNGGAPAWKLLAPDADLIDRHGGNVGRHYAGPTWEAGDGSTVIGALLERANAPVSDAVDWLLVEAEQIQGSGVFSQVTFINRVNTRNGKSPAKGCDTQHIGRVTRVPYTATYYFYRAGH